MNEFVNQFYTAVNKSFQELINKEIGYNKKYNKSDKGRPPGLNKNEISQRHH
jgi:hypothetical protein